LILPKEWELLKEIETMNLESIRKPTSWTSGNEKIPDLEFGIIKDIPKDYCRTEFYFELFSDRSSIIITINNKVITKRKYFILCNTNTK